MSLLETIKNPQDLKKIKNLDKLAAQIRLKIVDITNKNGGHLASNLGVVELTIALLLVFPPFEKENLNFKIKNSIIWDVGHQCYAYKMLTGRYDKINSIRNIGGLSGFSDATESAYDMFSMGHASNSISLALGLCQSNIEGKKIAIIGDGALTGGLAYEGLNNCSKFGKNLLVILNDNEMSISKNVGFIAKYLTHLRTVNSYLKTKKNIKNLLNSLPFFGEKFKEIMVRGRQALKSTIIKRGTIFEDMGFSYFGPFDGHDIKTLVGVFRSIKNIKTPIFVHIVTKKGKGYRNAEDFPSDFHGVNKIVEKNKVCMDFSTSFGKQLCSLAMKNEKIYVITAAMTGYLGLNQYAAQFPDRFSDVGIAEGHAVTFAGGLAKGGMVPFFCVYSTFLQRSIDQILHDVLMQNLKIVMAIDRAGFIGTDGQSHQGIFDVSFFRLFNNIKVFFPSFYEELDEMLIEILSEKMTCAIRYPKGIQFFKPSWQKYENEEFEIYKNDGIVMKLVYIDKFLNNNNETLVITYGRIFSFASKILEEFIKKIILIKINKLNFMTKNFIEFLFKFKRIVFFEEHIKTGGIGEMLMFEMLKNGFNGIFELYAIDKTFVKHAQVEEQLSMFNLDYLGMKKKIFNQG